MDAQDREFLIDIIFQIRDYARDNSMDAVTSTICSRHK